MRCYKGFMELPGGMKRFKNHLTMLDEAEKRDHRKIEKLDLFHLQEQAAGSVFWHSKGWFIYRKIMEYMRARLSEAKYERSKYTTIS